MLWRGTFGAAVVTAVACAQPAGWRRVVPVRWGLVILRSLLLTVAMLFYFSALSLMSIARARPRNVSGGGGSTVKPISGVHTHGRMLGSPWP